MSDGLDYSRCPVDGCQEVDLRFKNGGQDGKQHEYRDWQIFSADPRKGGCGASWSTATRQGYEARTEKGQPTRGLTRSAEVDSTQSVPSQRFMTNYEMIDWSK